LRMTLIFSATSAAGSPYWRRRRRTPTANLALQ
jgi:hypothetical protein